MLKNNPAQQGDNKNTLKEEFIICAREEVLSTGELKLSNIFLENLGKSK